MSFSHNINITYYNNFIKSLVEVVGFEPTSLYPFFQTSTRLFCCEFQKVTQQTNLPFLFVLLLYGISNEKIVSEFSVNDLSAPR